MTQAITLTAPNDVWQFGSDLKARRTYFNSEVFSHPAKLHLGLLQRLIDTYTVPGDVLLDPMAGTGSLMIAATQQRDVIVRDLQPEYVAMMNRSAERIRHYAGLFAGLMDIGQADAKALTCPAFNHIIFSPPYGCETNHAADNVARLRRMHQQGALVTADRRWKLNKLTTFVQGFEYAGATDNTGNKRGTAYWLDMQAIYERLVMLLPVGGFMIAVVKNHIRAGVLIDITGETVARVTGLGLNLYDWHARYISNPSLWQRRRKEQGLPIVELEDVLVFRKANP